MAINFHTGDPEKMRIGRKKSKIQQILDEKQESLLALGVKTKRVWMDFKWLLTTANKNKEQFKAELLKIPGVTEEFFTED